MPVVIVSPYSREKDEVRRRGEKEGMGRGEGASEREIGGGRRERGGGREGEGGGG